MQPSALPWRRLAWLALLGALPLGCATSGKAPVACVGRYEVQVASYAAGRQQASDASDLLAERLGRKAMVVSSTMALYRAVLDDDRVDPPARVKLLVTHPEGAVWWISVVKATQDEDDRSKVVRAHVEQVLTTLGVKWTYDVSDRDLKE
jgi:hypothetical protein